MPSIRQQIADFVSTTLTAAVLQTSGSNLTADKVVELKHKASILAVAAQKPSASPPVSINSRGLCDV